jgi:hypothetical protein
MPPYKFLFEQRLVKGAPSPDALKLPAGFEPKQPGVDIVPTREAKQLVAYLMSRRIEAPLFEAPLILPKPPSTNAPAGSTNAPVATNVLAASAVVR